MKTHDTFLELAAIGIDFPLKPSDRGRLDRHLAGCLTCERSVAALRADAAAIGALPRPTLPERRGAEILAAALHPGLVRAPVRLVAVAALLGLLLVGSLFVGSELINRDENPVIVPPLPTETPGPDASAMPSADPSAEPTAGPTADPALFTWSHATLPILADRPIGAIEAVTAGGPGYVAVGRGCFGQDETGRCEAVVLTSADGQSWTRTAASDATDTGFYLGTSGPEIGMFDVAAGDPGIVAIGYAARPNLQSTIWFSVDGSAWERIPLGLDGSGSTAASADRFAVRVHAVTWDGRSFVAVGEDRTEAGGSVEQMLAGTARAAVWTSLDGRTWTRVPHAPVFDVGRFIDTMEDPASGGMRDVMAGPAGLVAIGSVCTSAPVGCEPAAWISPDGTAWERVDGMPAISGILKAIARSDAGYVAVGARLCDSSPVAIPYGCPALVLTSSDGRAWVQQPFDQSGDVRTVTRIGSRFVATTPDGPETVWMSDDGSAWVAVEPPGGSATDDGGLIFELHFAATADSAVCLGPSANGDEPAAWVSDAIAP